LLSVALAAQEPNLRIQVIDGEGIVHRTGARASAAVRVKVSDESGNAVAGAVVGFRLPDEGPTGFFPNELNTQVVSTAEDGTASTPSIRWNATPGTLYLRIAAVKGTSSAGAVVQLQLASGTGEKGGNTGAGPARPQPAGRSGSKLRSRLVVVGLAVASAAGAGFAFGRSRESRTGSATPAGPARIGVPRISIGRP
jgi:hypothetical protein